MANKEICGHCCSYDMWCGICLHPESKLFEMDADEIYEYPCCELFAMEDSYGNTQKVIVKELMDKQQAMPEDIEHFIDEHFFELI